MASGDLLAVLLPSMNEPPATIQATMDTRNAHPVIEFDQSADEEAVWTEYMLPYYGGGGVTLSILWTADGIASGNVIWDAQWELIDPNVLDIDADSFAAVQSTAAIAVPATDGFAKETTISFTNGAQMDSVAASTWYRLKVRRDANHASDTAAADVQILAVLAKET